jgi:hypothetical protein
MKIIKRKRSAIIPYVILLGISGWSCYAQFRQVKLSLLGAGLFLATTVALVFVIRGFFFGYIVIDGPTVTVRSGMREKKFSLDELEAVSMTDSEVGVARFILKTGKMISFDIKALSEPDIQFILTLGKGMTETEH